MKQKLKKCPMCSGGWIDIAGEPVKPIRSKYNCEFCGSTGELVVLDNEDIEGEKDGRILGRV